ncbi:MAG: TIGR04348 family glycosyltransferase [Betaproteobacteria bacterium]|nr:MAG: TIGR04348 family glycosyltransferase [Betaproteobacteria bacterium]
MSFARICAAPNERAAIPTASFELCDSSSVKPTVVIVSPANAKANNGNWHTAARWARFLSHDYAVKVVERWSTGAALPDVLFTMHARRSSPSLLDYRAARAKGGVLLALTGTDVYRDIHEDELSKQSLKLADRMIVLQPAALEELSSAHRAKTDVVYQSAAFLKPVPRYQRWFDVVQVGHLRHEKDPFTPITALRQLPSESRIRLTHIGNPLDQHHTDTMTIVTRDEPRLRWLGGIDHAATRQRIKRAHALVIASKMEGGANVIVEAVTSGVPVIASHISGNRGMLGDDYPGYFELGDATACAKLMRRIETDTAFYKRLYRAAAKRAQLFAPHREAAAILAAVARVLAD